VGWAEGAAASHEADGLAGEEPTQALKIFIVFQLQLGEATLLNHPTLDQLHALGALVQE